MVLSSWNCFKIRLNTTVLTCMEKHWEQRTRYDPFKGRWYGGTKQDLWWFLLKKDSRSASLTWCGFWVPCNSITWRFLILSCPRSRWSLLHLAKYNRTYSGGFSWLWIRWRNMYGWLVDLSYLELWFCRFSRRRYFNWFSKHSRCCKSN